MKLVDLFESFQTTTLQDIVAMHGHEIKGIGPVTVDVFRAGPIDDRYGIFFGSSHEDADAYSFGEKGFKGERGIKKYQISAKNVLIAPSQWAAYGFLRGKPFDGGSFDQIAFKLKSTVEANRHIDMMITKKIRAAGYDAAIYSNPRPPARFEMHVVNTKTAKIEELL